MTIWNRGSQIFLTETGCVVSRRIALELVNIVGLLPAQQNIDEIEVDVGMNVCHVGLLCLVMCCYGSHHRLRRKINHCANAQKNCDLFTLGANATNGA